MSMDSEDLSLHLVPSNYINKFISLKIIIKVVINLSAIKRTVDDEILILYQTNLPVAKEKNYVIDNK